MATKIITSRPSQREINYWRSLGRDPVTHEYVKSKDGKLLREVGYGNYIEVSEYDRLDKYQKDYIDKFGVDLFNQKYGNKTTIISEKQEMAAKASKLPSVKPAAETKRVKITPWTKATVSAETAQAIREFGKMPDITTKEGLKKEADIIATAVVPALWTKDIKDMSNWQIGLNTALDLLFIIPFAKAIKATLSTAKPTFKTVARQVSNVETKYTNNLVKAIDKAYGKDSGNLIKDVVKEETRYADALADFNRLKSKKRVSESQLTSARVESELASQDLKASVNKMVTDMKNKGVGFDSPEVKKYYDDMPSEVVRSVDEAIKSTQATKANIKQLEADVLKARKELELAQEKYPTNPSKWSDLIGNVLEKESKLKTAQTGSITKVHSELIKVNNKLKTTKNINKRNELIKKKNDLTKTLHSSINSMEIIYGRGGEIPRGTTITQIRTKPYLKPSSKPTRTKAQPTTRISAVAQPRLVTKTVIEKVPIIKPKPFIPIVALPKFNEAVKTYGLNKADATRIINELARQITEVVKEIPEIVPMIAPIIDTSASVIIKSMVENATDAEIASKVNTSLENLTRAKLSPKTREQLKPKLKTITKTATKLITRIVPKTSKIPPIKITLDNGEVVTLTKKQYDSIIAWKQGFMYKMIWYPYGKKDIYNSRKPIAEVKYHEGIDSAAKSAIAKGVPPKVVERDMGIVDLKFETKSPYVQPRLTFSRDVKQRTTKTGRHSGRPTTTQTSYVR